MSHFAHIDPNTSIVDSVIVISQETLDNKGGWYVGSVFKPKEEWVQTSYNISRGNYKKGDTEAEKLALKTGGTTADIAARSRKNYAGKGFKYDKANDVFIAPQPYPSWKLDKTTATWYAPKPYPTDGKMYAWSEESLAWVIPK